MIDPVLYKIERTDECCFCHKKTKASWNSESSRCDSFAISMWEPEINEQEKKGKVVIKRIYEPDKYADEYRKINGGRDD
jgi:hypothetical protein